MDDKNAISITVKGLVQGVWYRMSTREKARALHLKGYVQNQEDGSVYIIAEGGKAPLSNLIQWCKIGPKMARVESIDVTHIAYQGFEGFEIKRKQ